MVYHVAPSATRSPEYLQADIDVRGGFGLEQVQAPPRHLEEQGAERLEVLGIAREQVEACERRLVGDAAGEERIRVGIDREIRVDVEQVLPRDADQELLDAEPLSANGPAKIVSSAYHLKTCCGKSSLVTAASRAARPS